MFYFYKIQANGNDFVLVDYTKQKFEYNFKLLAEFLCDRHYGVGADGLIVIDKSKIADIKMRIFNKDGSEAEMCGNGIMCFSKYVYEHNILKKENFRVETKAGIKNIELTIEGKSVLKVKVDMGTPSFDFEKIPIMYYECDKKDLKKQNINKEYRNEISRIDIDGKIFYPISIGNPHVVCFTEKLSEIDIQQIGRKIENYKYFPNKTNVEFVEIINKDRIKLRVWERGVGETLSCGTGSCAAGIVSHIVKSTNSELIVDLAGGVLKVMYDKENEKVYLEGEAKEVYSGSINI